MLVYWWMIFDASQLGVSYLDVAQAATKLMEQNVRPSIEEVRKLLGTGSNSTINRHLREWRSKQGNQIELEQGLPESLLIAVKSIYEAIKEEAENRIKATETKSRRALADLQTQLDQVNKNNAQLAQEKHSLENSLNQSNAEKSAFQHQLDQLSKKLQEKIAENNLLNERLHDKKTDIDRLDQQLKHAQNNLEYYRESMLKEREADISRYEKNTNKLAAEVSRYQTLSAQFKERNSILQHKLNSLEEEKQEITVNLEKMQSVLDEHKYTLQSQSETLEALHKQYNDISSENAHLVYELKSNKETINSLRLKLENSEGRIKELLIALKKTEDNVTNFTNKNMFLMQEKTELAAQLKQLKFISTGREAL